MSSNRTRRVGRIKASVLKWLGVPVTLSDGDFWAAYYGTDASGKPINIDCALQVSTVWACVRLISQAISTLPLFLYRRDGGPDSNRRQVARNHPLFTLIHSLPNKNSTAVIFWEAIVASLLLRGAAYVEMRVIGGIVRGLFFLDPDCVERRLLDGAWHYRSRNLDGTVRDLVRDRLWIIPGFTTDGETGMSVIGYGAMVFGNAHAANKSAGKLLANGMRATAYARAPSTRRVHDARSAQHSSACSSARRPGMRAVGSTAADARRG